VPVLVVGPNGVVGSRGLGITAEPRVRKLPTNI
jgi:hypothetical protein